jgi:hypothetical protein
MIKGITFSARPSHTLEGAGSIYQSSLFAYIVGILFGIKYYHYPNLINPLGEKVHTVDFEKEWESMFGMLGAQNENLAEFFHKEILVHYKFLSDYHSINYELVANIDFQSAHSIIQDNWLLYKEKIYPAILALFRKHNTYTPAVSYVNAEKFNITLHLRTHVPQDLPADQNIMAWQSFNLSHGDTLNTDFYSKLYSGLVNKLVAYAKQKSQKPIAINIFSRGEPSLFENLCNSLDDSCDVNLYLNSKAADTFLAFTEADFLICAHSSFSWLASHLNPNPSFTRYPFRQILSPNGYYFDDNLNITKG